MQSATPTLRKKGTLALWHSTDKQRPHAAKGGLEPGNPPLSREKVSLLVPTGMMLKTVGLLSHRESTEEGLSSEACVSIIPEWPQLPEAATPPGTLYSQCLPQGTGNRFVAGWGIAKPTGMQGQWLLNSGKYH